MTFYSSMKRDRDGSGTVSSSLKKKSICDEENFSVPSPVLRICTASSSVVVPECAEVFSEKGLPNCFSSSLKNELPEREKKVFSSILTEPTQSTSTEMFITDATRTAWTPHAGAAQNLSSKRNGATVSSLHACPYCDKYYVFKHSLTNHISLRHKAVLDNDRSVTAPLGPGRRRGNLSRLGRPGSTLLGAANIDEISGAYRCNWCFTSHFASKNKLRRHQRYHCPFREGDPEDEVDGVEVTQLSTDGSPQPRSVITSTVASSAAGESVGRGPSLRNMTCLDSSDEGAED